MYDVTKIISMIKGKRGEHRLFRLAENLCMNLILSLKDFFFVKKELKVLIPLASLSRFDSHLSYSMNFLHAFNVGAN